MNRHVKHLNNLLNIANDVIPVAAAKIAASIVINNKTISYGVNSYKSSPFQKRFGKNEESICVHAEISAIKNALNKMRVNDLSSATLYVARSKKENGNLVQGMVKPCSGCQRAIAAFNIKKVYYTEETTGYSCL